jgi:hypothetical protein
MTKVGRQVLLALLFAGVAKGVQAQASPCLTQPDSVLQYRYAVAGIFANSDSAEVVAEDTPWGAFQNIQVVADSPTCAQGLVAFNDMAGYTGTPRVETAAYILAIGGTGYAFIRPDDTTTGGRRFIYLFSTTWEFVASIIG